ncbi:DUF5704 domain-containing protein [Lysinibacillus sp. K60]|uniref:DUF5704 domain-containing protein n=1 Tax=Lysinibacillus sp. K60 TaxID=2720027 RepID=UPI001C8B1849|nr:hypothetical protein [Lysinibacillus sp. K60]
MRVHKKEIIYIISFLAIFIFWFNMGGTISVSAERIEVITEKVEISPIVHWWQIDNGNFRAENWNGPVETTNAGTVENPFPKNTDVHARLNLRDYPMPNTFHNVNDEDDTYDVSEVKGIEGTNPQWGSTNGKTYLGKFKGMYTIDVLEIKVETGIDYIPEIVKKYGDSGPPKYNPKFHVAYPVKMWVQWKGYVEKGGPGGGPGEGPSCSVDFELGPDGGSQTKGLTEPSPSGSISSDSGEFDVVQGIPSSEYLRADAKSEEYLYEQDFVQRTGNTVFNGIPVSKTFTLTWTTRHKDSDGDYYYVDHSDTETVEVAISGIKRPFSYWEIITYNIWKLTHSEFTNYALPNEFLRIDALTNVTADGKHSDNVEDHVFPPDCPDITLPSESIDGGSSRPSVPDITGEATAAAEAEIGDNEVENDRAEFKGSVIMDDSRTTTDGPTPSDVPDPGMIDMSATGLLIDPLKTNYFESPSTGKVFYEPVFSIDGSASAKDFPFDVNPVTVHTPVVIYSRASDDKEHDQRIKPPLRSTPPNPDQDRHAFILDRPFTVSLPTGGQHRNIPGYGNRDYSKYIKMKQVMFPFDVYTATKQAFYPANTWISVPVDMETVEFFLPVWVPEKQYTIQFRAFAINALPSGDFGGSEHHANITIPNPAFNVPPAGSLSAAHVAIDSIQVDVVGRLYDFHVTDISDYNWKSVFRQGDGVTPTTNSYWVGLNGIDGAKRGNSNPFVLPVRHGSHPNGFQNVAVKTGYKFKFDMKTKGDMESINDAIRIKPTFYHVTSDGKKRQAVDLYYHDDNNYFVKIGSDKDKTYRTVSLNDTMRNVPKNEITNNALHYYNFADRFNLKETTSQYYETAFARYYAKHMSKEPVQTGPYGWQIQNWKLRTYRGPLANQVPPNTMVPPKEIVTKEQTWYGEYSLPAKLYVVPKNANVQEAGRVGMLNENHPLFLKDGFIIVNFDIDTINEGDLNNPYLSYYKAHYMSQWTNMEGFKNSFVDGYGNTFNLQEGDVIFYHADQSSLDDFKPSVTH